MWTNTHILCDKLGLWTFGERIMNTQDYVLSLFRYTYIEYTLHKYDFGNKSIRLGFIFGGNYFTEEKDIRKRNVQVGSDTSLLDCIRKDY